MNLATGIWKMLINMYLRRIVMTVCQEISYKQHRLDYYIEISSKENNLKIIIFNSMLTYIRTIVECHLIYWFIHSILGSHMGTLETTDFHKSNHKHGWNVQKYGNTMIIKSNCLISFSYEKSTQNIEIDSLVKY